MRVYTSSAGWATAQSLQAAINTAKSGGIVEVDEAVVVFANLDITSASNLTIRGMGRGVTTLRPSSTTGWAFDLTGASGVTFQDMTISPTTQARTEGGMFRGNGSQRLTWRNVQLAAFWRGMHLTNCSDCRWDQVRWVDYASAPLEYGVLVDGISSSMFFTDAIFQSSIQDGAVWARFVDVDTIAMYRCGAQKFSNARIAGVEILRGQWHHFTDCFFECGTLGFPAVKIEGAAYGQQFTACHLVTSYHGLQLVAEQGGGAPRNVRMTGGRVSHNGQHGVLVDDGFLHLTGVDLANNSSTESGTADAVHVVAGSALVDGCRIGTYTVPVSGGGTQHRFGVFGNVVLRDTEINDAVSAGSGPM